MRMADWGLCGTGAPQGSQRVTSTGSLIQSTGIYNSRSMRVWPASVTSERKTQPGSCAHPLLAVVLLADACQMFAPFEDARLVESNDNVLAPQVLQNKGTDLIAYSVGVPRRLRKQSLHAIPVCFPCLLSQLPAVFALGGAQNTLHKTQGPFSWFGSSKVGGQTSVQQDRLHANGSHRKESSLLEKMCYSEMASCPFFFHAKLCFVLDKYRVSHVIEKCLKRFFLFLGGYYSV